MEENVAKLYYRYGAMNCGKSTALMQVAYNYEERGMKVIIAKPVIDTKDGDMISSRLGLKRKVDWIIKTDTDIYNLAKQHIESIQNIDCMLIDEVQFLTSRQIDELFKIAIDLSIPVICYGIRTDFMMNGFDGSSRLLLIAHSIEELKTICACGRKALFNARKVNGNFIFEGEQVAIDNKNDVTYESLCGNCYVEKSKKDKIYNILDLEI